jgi:hypothetical protein
MAELPLYYLFKIEKWRPHDASALVVEKWDSFEPDRTKALETTSTGSHRLGFKYDVHKRA